ncbi:MAG: UDP-N-acetylmuramoyl-L-alanine--D-glutamate ligase [Proteobacteria bacterium]|nr:UDP-N-acetylmuramoyl-L-alanine--D-glutamate ligase [Pseudomonadota bacterium]
MNRKLYLVAGLGKTGHSIARFLQKRNRPFVVFDTREEQDISGLDDFKKSFPGVDVFCGNLPLTLYPQLKMIIASPGVALDEPFVIEAKKQNIPVIGDIECLAEEITAPIIAITGTNGKSTVTTLVGEIAAKAGYKVAVGGNLGTPVLDLLDDGKKYDLWVLELSSFQLELIDSLKFKSATILNVTTDHLDRHHTMEAYIEAKRLIYKRAEFIVFNREDKATLPIAHKPDAVISNFGLDMAEKDNWGIIEKEQQLFLAKGNVPILNVQELTGLKGKHNWQNAMAACALVSVLDIPENMVVDVLKNFRGLPHRCQWVRTLNDIEWINDSKGTNVGATNSALAGIGGAIKGQIILIAGGIGKGADFTELRPNVKTFVRSLILIGEDALKIEQAVGDLKPTFKADSFESAIKMAEREAKPGDIVLLSPACASFDMFNDFNHRGECFANLVGQL